VYDSYVRVHICGTRSYRRLYYVLQAFIFQHKKEHGAAGAHSAQRKHRAGQPTGIYLYIYIPVLRKKPKKIDEKEEA